MYEFYCKDTTTGEKFFVWGRNWAHAVRRNPKLNSDNIEVLDQYYID